MTNKIDKKIAFINVLNGLMSNLITMLLQINVGNKQDLADKLSRVVMLANVLTIEIEKELK